MTIRNSGSTDHMPITSVGIPAFNALQDPIDYDTRTHHTNLDVAAYLAPDDLKSSAAVLASLLYHVASRDAMIPRLPLPKPRARQ